MPATARGLADKLVDGRDVYAVIRTKTKVDVGSWLARGRVWIVALADSLVFVAVGLGGSRPLAEIIAYDRLGKSRYNHVTGQLALSPAKIAGVRGLRLPPIEGRQVLAQIYQER